MRIWNNTDSHLIFQWCPMSMFQKEKSIFLQRQEHTDIAIYKGDME